MKEDNPAIKETLDDAASAIKRGDIETGKTGLRWVFEREPDNVLAWLWMSRCTENADEKLECFNRVLAIDPNNKHALEGIRKFGGNQTQEESRVSPPAPSVEPKDQDSTKPKSRTIGCVSLLVLGVVVLGLWILIRPGVFTVQPIGALPEGATVIYHSRNPEMPFFSSPDGLCLEIQGSVSLLCRAMSLGAVDELADRILIRLPFMRFAYLQSTGGAEFEQ